MGAGATKIKATDILGNIVGTEPGALGEDGLELKGRTDVGVEARDKIKRGENEFTDEVFSQVGDDGFFERGQDAIGIGLFFFFPINLVAGRAEVRNRGEDVEALVARGG